MKATAALLLLALAATCNAAYFSDSLPWKNAGLTDVNGGTNCAACTVVVTLADQLAVVHNESVADVLAKICTWMPAAVEGPCDKMIKKFGPYIITFLGQKLSSDEVCLKMGVCKSATCRLFPKKTTEEGARKAVAERIYIAQNDMDWSFTPIDWLKKEIDRVFNLHEPLVDFDGDNFSTAKTFRGSSWRGKDCNDMNKEIYPGRTSDGSNPKVDGNCNGIFGVNSAGVQYEELFCNGTKQYGTVILGDSAAAHFHIPAEYMHAPDMNKTTFSELLFVAENEFDWPQQSSTTAFLETADRWDAGPISSLYGHLLKHNRCNHRDFQNIGVNGARSGAMTDIVKSYNRNQQTDKPAFVMFALIGNDVCNGHPDYYNHMTKVEDFRRSILTSLEYLDSVVPKGSHVLFTGLADGRILYETMAGLTHPIGAEYSAMYDFLNCLEISPCLVWMNSNSTIRDIGSARAAELNAVYSEILSNTSISFKNFDMAYYDLPIEEAIQQHVAAGGLPQELIEPIDGFHPSQTAMSLIADIQWARIMKDHPEWIGEENPNNNQIIAMFGDQGGY